MIEEVVEAIEQKNYRKAAQLVKELRKREPQNPWVNFYIGRLQEETGKLREAELVYRQLLRSTTHPKVISQARQGIARLEAIEAQQKKQALAQSMAQPGSEENAVLILEPIASELKQEAAQKFGKIMQLDAYTARLQLPSRNWRLYRTGSMGELHYYVKTLQKAGIPCFCVSLDAVKKLSVFQVESFQTVFPKVTTTCSNSEGKQGTFTFNWGEVSQRVEGRLPLFEEYLDMDVRRKFQPKIKTPDYVNCCDLHLPARKTILRICDRNYQFSQGLSLSPDTQEMLPPGQTTMRHNWDNLIQFLNSNLPDVPVWFDYTPFAETALGFEPMLEHINPHIPLYRREKNPWDAAFHLYSSAIFLKPKTPFSTTTK
ncbi:MAG: tetratricopeptide repeat protein [Chroococcales cyanobacterium]